MGTIEGFVQLLTVRLKFVVLATPSRVPDIDITHHLWLLDVPKDKLAATEDAAWRLAGEYFRDGLWPILISAVSPENTPLVKATP